MCLLNGKLNWTGDPSIRHTDAMDYAFIDKGWFRESLRCATCGAKFFDRENGLPQKSFVNHIFIRSIDVIESMIQCLTLSSLRDKVFN